MNMRSVAERATAPRTTNRWMAAAILVLALRIYELHGLNGHGPGSFMIVDGLLVWVEARSHSLVQLLTIAGMGVALFRRGGTRKGDG